MVSLSVSSKISIKVKKLNKYISFNRNLKTCIHGKEIYYYFFVTKNKYNTENTDSSLVTVSHTALYLLRRPHQPLDA